VTFVPEKPKRIPYPSYQVRGLLYFVAALTLFFWGLFIWSLTQGGLEPYAPITAIGSTIALVMGYVHLRRVKAQEDADSTSQRD
jgi:hypothetical protein